MAGRVNIKYPCLICNTSVRKNQNAALCIGCKKWCHVKCGVPTTDFESDVDWTCHKCTFKELPFHDISESQSETIDATIPYVDTSCNFNEGQCNTSCNTLEGILNRGLTISHLNVRSLRNKVDQISQYLSSNSIDLFSMSETWLDENVSLNLSVHGYSLERKDRNYQGGGVGCYIKSSISYVRRRDLECDDLEVMWIEIKSPNSRPWLVAIVYRTPSSNAAFFSNFESNVENVYAISHNLILIGDFNCNVLTENPLHAKLRSLCSIFNFEQLIRGPTRVTPNSSSCIDLIFVPKKQTDFKCGKVTIGISDHCLVYVNLKKMRVQCKPVVCRFRSFRKFNASEFVKEGEKLFGPSYYEMYDVNYLWNYFKESFIKLCDRHAPFVSVRKKINSAPWLTDDFLQLARRRDYLKRKFIETGNLQIWCEFKRVRNEVNNLSKHLKKEYYINEFEKNLRDAGRTWKTLKSLSRQTKSSNCTGLRTETSVLTEDIDVANAFNEYFARNTLGNSNAARRNKLNSVIKSKFHFEKITEEFVSKELSHLSVNMSSGLDGMHPRLLKEAAPFISKPLTHIFNVSISTGLSVPDWKLAKITPVFKSGDKNLASNYRPISVLSHVMKILEKALHKQLYTYLVSNNILSSSQSGFRPLFSTTTALIDVSDYLHTNIDYGYIIGALFLDFKRAFDLVNHSILLDKMYEYGVHNTELAWFKNYLSDRSQCVCYNGKLSTFRDVGMGIPQGSILGPLLFVIFINDICDLNFEQNTKICLYADDTALFCKGRDISSVQTSLQLEFEKLMLWVQMNDLKLNTSKSKVMLFGTRKKNYF